MESPLNSYRFGPLTYVTDMLLPELPRAEPAEGERPVRIRSATAPNRLTAPLAVTPTYEASASEFLLRLPGLATYYIRDGEEIVVERAPEALELDVQAYLLGSLFAVVCHQRGLLPLHASAIASPRGAVAFLGPSGAGKSSIAAFLSRRGHRILADDICLLDLAAPRQERVLPVAPWLKLKTTTLDAIGESSHGLSRAYSEDQKYRLMLQHEGTPGPLAELILLERAEDEKPVSFERLPPVHAIRGVLDLTFLSWLVRNTGETEDYFLRCGKALDGVRVTRMRRPWGFDAMEANLTALEAHLATPASATAL